MLSLALVMLTATGLLAAVFLEINHARVETLHGLLGRGFVSAARDPAFEHRPIEGGLWWRVDEAGRVTGLNASADRIDPETRALAREVLDLGEPLVQSGAPWAPLRFATPRPWAEGAIVGRIDAPVSGGWLLALLVTDVLIFGLFGVTLLRRRVVGPLHRLAGAVRDLGAGDAVATVPVEGAREIEDLGRGFNEMQDALAARTGALEKAVQELRTANETLLQAREGLDRAERLAMVGSLAAGVAHEVGNPMGALLAFLELTGRDPGLGAEGRRSLDRATEQGERVRVILRQLLDFSRPPQVEHGPIDLVVIARQAVELVSAQKTFSDVDFRVEVERPGSGEDGDATGPGAGGSEEATLPPALGDASLASQILLNLILNAASALEDGRAPRRIRVVVAPEARRRRAGDDPEAELDRWDAIVCRVEDSGPGVRLEDPERVFDPFFTTKPPGEGTGLGLANARRLAEEMGGAVELEPASAPLGGACFRFRLPCAGDRRAPSTEVRGAGASKEHAAGASKEHTAGASREHAAGASTEHAAGAAQSRMP